MKLPETYYSYTLLDHNYSIMDYIKYLDSLIEEQKELYEIAVTNNNSIQDEIKENIKKVEEIKNSFMRKVFLIVNNRKSYPFAIEISEDFKEELAACENCYATLQSEKQSLEKVLEEEKEKFKLAKKENGDTKEQYESDDAKIFFRDTKDNFLIFGTMAVDLIRDFNVYDKISYALSNCFNKELDENTDALVDPVYYYFNNLNKIITKMEKSWDSEARYEAMNNFYHEFLNTFKNGANILTSLGISIKESTKFYAELSDELKESLRKENFGYDRKSPNFNRLSNNYQSVVLGKFIEEEKNDAITELESQIEKLDKDIENSMQDITIRKSVIDDEKAIVEFIKSRNQSNISIHFIEDVKDIRERYDFILEHIKVIENKIADLENTLNTLNDSDYASAFEVLNKKHKLMARRKEVPDSVIYDAIRVEEHRLRMLCLYEDAIKKATPISKELDKLKSISRKSKIFAKKLKEYNNIWEKFYNDVKEEFGDFSSNYINLKSPLFTDDIEYEKITDFRQLLRLDDHSAILNKVLAEELLEVMDDKDISYNPSINYYKLTIPGFNVSTTIINTYIGHVEVYVIPTEQNRSIRTEIQKNLITALSEIILKRISVERLEYNYTDIYEEAERIAEKYECDNIYDLKEKIKNDIDRLKSDIKDDQEICQKLLNDIALKILDDNRQDEENKKYCRGLEAANISRSDEGKIIRELRKIDM